MAARNDATNERLESLTGFALYPCSSFLIIKPTRCTNFFQIYFWIETLHVSDSSSVHNQEFFHCTHSNGICHIGLLTACEQDQDGTTVSS